LSPNEQEVLAVHLEIDDLQVPSSQSTGDEEGQMIWVGQFSRELADEPSAHLIGLLEGLVLSS